VSGNPVQRQLCHGRPTIAICYGRSGNVWVIIPRNLRLARFWMEPIFASCNCQHCEHIRCGGHWLLLEGLA
jgi:hypothetical protein